MFYAARGPNTGWSDPFYPRDVSSGHRSERQQPDSTRPEDGGKPLTRLATAGVLRVMAITEVKVTTSGPAW